MGFFPEMAFSDPEAMYLFANAFGKEDAAPDLMPRLAALAVVFVLPQYSNHGSRCSASWHGIGIRLRTGSS